MAGFRCELSPTAHARDEMHAEGIENREVLAAILHGKKSRYGPKKVMSVHLGVGVIYILKPCHFHVITAFRK